jgi:hypothetical protein
MRKLYLLGSSCCFAVCLHAQTIFTAQAATPLYISPSTIFYAGGLALQPTTGFTITNNSLEKATTLVNYTVSQYAARVYKFTHNTGLYSGLIGMRYEDAELSGMAESMLEINLHDNAQWWNVGTSAFDITENYVISNAVSGIALNELTIANMLMPLPLQWGAVKAFRAQQTITVSWQTKQEQQVKNFTVERSRDGISWQTIGNAIPAKNSAQGGLYKITDLQYQPLQVYYRIKQTDFNGEHSFSNIVTVEAVDTEQGRMLLFPNPVTESFKLTLTNNDVVTSATLYNSTGIQIKSWTSAPVYSINGQKPGTYLLVVTTRQNRTHHFKIIKH